MRKLPTLTIPTLTMPTGTRRLTQDWGSPLYDAVRYHAFSRVRVNGHVGTLFTTDSVSDIARDFPTEYNNVVILSGHSQYAPEQRHAYVFVADRAMRA